MNAESAAQFAELESHWKSPRMLAKLRALKTFLETNPDIEVSEERGVSCIRTHVYANITDGLYEARIQAICRKRLHYIDCGSTVYNKGTFQVRPDICIPNLTRVLNNHVGPLSCKGSLVD